MTASTAAEHGRATVVRSTDGTPLHVRTHGPSAAPSILFVHGMSADSLVWADQVDRLAAERRVITLDIRGHGRSGDPADQSYSDADQWADDLDAVIDRCTTTAPAVVGWSYGGMIVGDYLRKYGPDRVSGVYLVAPLRKIGTAEAVDLLDPSFLQLVPGLLATDISELLPATRQFLDLISTRPFGDAEAYERLGAALSVPSHVRAAMLGRELDNDDVWQDSGVPLGVAFGDADRIVTPESSRAFADLVPGASVHEYRDGGHAPFLDDPGRFASELVRFVSDLDPAGSARRRSPA
ncbi:alpha/beta fold hydrolase [Nocardia sp. R7R-8]|uniref:alpha/beta fold hydrolase n=1 Tax=Nocardia sp. R7R-8 TaxID=3459304 RepID=UPI00403E2205